MELSTTCRLVDIPDTLQLGIWVSAAVWVTHDVNSSSNSNSSALLRVRACLSHMVSSYGSFERYQELWCSATSCCAHEVHEGILTEPVMCCRGRCTVWPLVGELHKLTRFSGWMELYHPATSTLVKTSRVWQQCRHTRQEVQCPSSLRHQMRAVVCVLSNGPCISCTA